MSDTHRRALLISRSQRLRSPLSALMEESPPGPPVPPKDPGYQSSMDGSRPPTAQSGSKRKRETQDDMLYDPRNGRLHAGDPDGHTPKRSRSAHRGVSDGDISTDETPMQARNLRRKKGSRNLSNLNLRHAASMPMRQTSPTRESKFQEGSLNDKPSQKPPSFFTRFQRTDSGNLMQVDQLMEDYHEGIPTPADSVQAAIEYEKATRDQRVAEITRQKKEEKAGIFQFGSKLASNLNPVALWNRFWEEEKEALTREAWAEAERKARMKLEAEARYRQMKEAGQFTFQPASQATPRDSGIVLDSASTVQEHQRNTSYGSAIRSSFDDMTSRDGSEMPESAVKSGLRSMTSRLHLRKPSLQSLKGGLKRMSSTVDLSGRDNREPSSSISPTKGEFEPSTLRKSRSKYDLKNQKKLSKRVSNLELELNKARGELENALNEASPMPELGSKHKRWTPSGTLRKPKFVPGALPTLPSERVLFPDQLNFGVDAGQQTTAERRPRKALDLSEAFDDIDEDDEGTMKGHRARSFPPRVKQVSEQPSKASLRTDTLPRAASVGSDLDDSDSDDEANANTGKEATIGQLTSGLTALPQMNANTAAGEDVAGPTKQASSGDLDAKLKALDANVKIAKKPAPKSKKRTSLQSDDKAFRPGKESDDDAEWEEAAHKSKKRKSGGKTEVSPQNKRYTGAGKTKSPKSKIPRKSVASPQTSKKAEKQVVAAEASPSKGGEDAEMADADGSEDELAKIASVRGSMGSEEQLEPVYEEEEETTTVPLKDEPSKPTAKATPARYTGLRSRSNSPNKRSGPVHPGAEEKMITRAANAAQKKRGSRSRSPPPAKVEIKTTRVVSVTPGQGDVPNLPSGANGSFESLPNPNASVDVLSKKEKRISNQEKYEWPDDVF